MQNISYEDLLGEREPQMMLIEFGYSNKYIVAHETGMQILELMKNCERYKDDYNKTPEINPMVIKDSFTISIMGISEYKRIKLEQVVLKDNDNNDNA